VGQKTNPKAFRLVTTQKHLSNWYSNKFTYSNLIEEDFLIRKTINEFFDQFLSISEIEISRVISEKNEKNTVNITINALFPRAVQSFKTINSFLNEENVAKKQLIDSSLVMAISKKNNYLKNNLKSITLFLLKQTTRQVISLLQKKTNKNYFIKIKFLKHQVESAKLIAKYIALQLERRVSFGRAMQFIIKKVQNNSSLNGVKIEISGRINNVEKAKTVWKRDGKIPLHTLKTKIDYTHQIAQTVSGILGIKVWLFIS
jgi:small subunit ribosomal protein S3